MPSRRPDTIEPKTDAAMRTPALASPALTRAADRRRFRQTPCLYGSPLALREWRGHAS